MTGLPVLPPFAAIVEIAVFFIPIALIETFDPTIIDFSTWQPHPFWLPVLLLSLQYGTVSGLLAASIAIGVSVLLGFPEQEVGENHFAYLLRIWLQPVLWIAAAVILGQFRLGQISERNALQERLDEALTQRRSLAAHAENYRQRCERLERQFATRPVNDATALVDRLLDISSGSGPEHFQAVLDCIAIVTPGADASLFRAGPEGLSLVARRGSLGEDIVQSHIARDSGLFRSVVGEGRQLNALFEGDAALLDGIGLAAVPVSNAAGDRIVGMIKIDFAPASIFSEDLTDRLAVVSRHAVDAFSADDQHGDAGNPLRQTPQTSSARIAARRRMAWQRPSRPVEARVVATPSQSTKPRTPA